MTPNYQNTRTFTTFIVIVELDSTIHARAPASSASPDRTLQHCNGFGATSQDVV
jgi:hypothetical protein